MRPRSSGLVQWVLIAAVALGLAGCAGLTGSLRDAPEQPGPVATAPPPAKTQVATTDAVDLSTERSGPDLAAVAMALNTADRRLSFRPTSNHDPFDLALRVGPDDPWASPYARTDARLAILVATDSDAFGSQPGLPDPWTFLDTPRDHWGLIILAASGEIFDIPRWPTSDPWHRSDTWMDSPPLFSQGAEEETFLIAQRPAGEPPPIEEIEEYDPWEPFNESMFEVNLRLDRWFIKPAAKGYDAIMPGQLQLMIANGFDNIAFVPRFVNSLLQGKFGGAGRELLRFVLNSTFGVAGLFDVGKQEGIRKSSEDFGQTLGVWGAGPGPYLVLPLLPPLTVRDAIGFFVDGAMDPLVYLLPFIPDRLAMKGGDTLNDRSLNIELFEGFEETTIDLYSAVRNAYLQRRLKSISE